MRDPQNHPEGNLPVLVKHWARATPAAPAVVEQGSTLTYDQLDARSGALACILRDLGVTRDIVVGLCLERSVRFVIAALGVMKAGGAYLPLEPSHPSQRLAFQLADAKAHVLVTSAEIQRNKPLACKQVMLLEKDRILPKGRAQETFCADIQERDLAYVIYTSGSTGQPKGVEIAHSSLSNLISWHRTAFQVTESDRASHLASVCFDAAVWELWPYLAAGACLDLADDAVAKNPELLREWLLERGITCCFAPTRIAEYLMKMEWPSAAPLRLMLTGGERLHRFPPAGLPFQVVNNYGPTECTVVATSGVLRSAERSAGLPPIGSPIANTTVHILDARLKPVREGEQGEIWIGGRGLARGYLGRPELTAERFGPNPFDPRPGSRIYRTGDSGRMLPDRQIEYLGRIDRQVKIRGYRTEPEEVECLLDRHPCVTASAVMVNEARPGETRLLAYVVRKRGCEVAASELRSFLAAQVPEHMIPTSLTFLESFPVTASGKLDRNALRSGETAEKSGVGSSKAKGKERLPEDEIERKLQEMWQEIFHVPFVPPRADFFYELNGDSLQAVQMCLEIEKQFGVKLPASVLLEHRTVEDMARVLREPRAPSHKGPLLTLQPRGRGDPIFCIHSHDGEALLFHPLADYAGASRPVYAFQAEALGGGPLRFSVEETAARYAEEALNVCGEGTYALFGVCFGGLVAFEMAQCLVRQGCRVSFLGMFNTPAPGSLAGWPLGQLSYLRRRIGDELAKMGSLSKFEKRKHLARNAVDFWRMVVRSIKIEVWRLTGGVVRGRASERLGEDLLDLEQINIAAGKNYRPHGVFPGQITYLQSPENPYPFGDSPVAGWRPFAARGIETVSVSSAEGMDPGRALMRTLAETVQKAEDAQNRRQVLGGDGEQPRGDEEGVASAAGGAPQRGAPV